LHYSELCDESLKVCNVLRFINTQPYFECLGSLYVQVDGMLEITKETTELCAPENAWILQVGRSFVSRTRRLTGSTVWCQFSMAIFDLPSGYQTPTGIVKFIMVATEATEDAYALST
jgi:hypothetical protein